MKTEENVSESKRKWYTKKLFLLVIVVVILLMGFFWSYRMSGKVTVIVNGKKECLTNLECKSLSSGNKESILHVGGSSFVYFMNSGFNHDMYEYSFAVSNEDISVMPKICVFKTNRWAKYNLDISVNMYKEESVWNGDVTVKVNGHLYTKSFEDIENNEMEIRVE